MRTLRDIPANQESEVNITFSGPLRLRCDEYLANCWGAKFRTQILPLLPVDKIAESFCPSNGRPTKDLVTMTGLVVLQEMFNLTDEDVLGSLIADSRFHMALGLTELTDATLSITPRTYHSFRKRLATLDLGGVLFADVTKKLIKRFGVDLSHQRIDSVHIVSNMRKSGRLAVLEDTVEQFLRELRKKDPAAFQTIDSEMVEEYLPSDKSDGECFGLRQKPSRRRNAMIMVAADMYSLVSQFESHPVVREMDSYQLLARVLGEQCEIKRDGRRWAPNEDDADDLVRADPELFDHLDEEVEDLAGSEVSLKDPKDVSSRSVQNPSDPGASYSGHKGKGYQVQVTETFVPSHDPEVKGKTLCLITDAHVEGAANSDTAALEPAVNRLVAAGNEPEKMVGDTSYGSEKNFEFAAENGIELVAPVPGKEGAPKSGTGLEARGPVESGPSLEWCSTSFPYDAADRAEVMDDETEPPAVEQMEPIRLSDFGLDDDGEIDCCPMGVARIGIETTGLKSRVDFPHTSCSGCPRMGCCPVKVTKKRARLTYEKIDLNTSIRRARQRTDEFLKLYSWRAGIEGTNSFLARLGLKRLRVRGLKNVELKAKLKALGANIRRLFAYLTRNMQPIGFWC